MESFKKYISPGAWFSMEYPAVWSEFEDSEGWVALNISDQMAGNLSL